MGIGARLCGWGRGDSRVVVGGSKKYLFSYFKNNILLGAGDWGCGLARFGWWVGMVGGRVRVIRDKKIF